MKKNHVSESDKQKVKSCFLNTDIQDLFIAQLNEVYQDSSIANCTLSLTFESQSLYLYFQYKKQVQNSQQQNIILNNSAYCIRVTKAFPLSGVRIYILSNHYQPKIFDSRDLCCQILYNRWHYKYRLVDIFKNLQKFEQKLSFRNNNYLSMQKTGQFIIQDIFTEHELKKFPCLRLFKDISKQDGNIVATTQTHVLTFKKISKTQKKLSNNYQLIRAYEMQCISDIYVSQKQEIIIAVNKYKNIKQFNEYQKVSRKYVLDKTHQFLYNILKNIGKFQKNQLSLQLRKFPNKNTSSAEKISTWIQQSKQYQQRLRQQQRQEQKHLLQQELIKMYHKIIDYYSTKENAYHLVFVSKLNKIYQIKTLNQ